MIKIMPSILGQENKAKLVDKAIKLGLDTIHYDVMDGEFVENFSMPIAEIKDIISKSNEHKASIHLMVNEVEGYVHEFQEVDYETLSFHFDATDKETINRILDKGYKGIGLAINPSTEFVEYKEFLSRLSHVVIMSVQAGKGGQEFIQDTLVKLNVIKQYITSHELNCEIIVDGGVNNQTIDAIKAIGVDRVVVGSYLMKNFNEKTIKELQK